MNRSLVSTSAGPLASVADDPPLWRMPAALLALGLVALRLAYLAFPELFPEEAYYWLYARHLAPGYLDHPPLVAWLIALGTALFGDTAFGVRVFAFLSSLVTSFFVCRLTALLYGRRAAAFALLAVQVLPFFFLVGFVMTPDAPLTACWAGMLSCLACAIFQRRGSAWFGVGVCLGLGLLSKYTVALLGPATLLFLALDPASRFWFRRAAPYLGVGLSLLIFSPVIWWNAAHHWASFAFQTTGRTRVRHRFSLHELAGAILVVLTPVGVYLAGRSLFGRPPPAPGAAPGDAFARRRRLFTRVFTLVPLAVFVFFSLLHRVKLNWTGPLWLAVVPAVAAQLAAAAHRAAASPPPWLRPAWHVTVGLCALAYLACLHHLAFGLPGLKYSRRVELLPVGWSDLARAVDQQKIDLARTRGGPVYVVGMDRNFVASELSFYQSDRAQSLRETTGSHLFQGDSLMFRTWFPATNLDGATVLLVSLDKNELVARRLSPFAREIGPVRTAVLAHRGQPIRPYYTCVLTGYHAAPK